MSQTTTNDEPNAVRPDTVSAMLTTAENHLDTNPLKAVGIAQAVLELAKVVPAGVEPTASVARAQAVLRKVAATLDWA